MEAPAQQRRFHLATFRLQKEKPILMLSPATRMDLEIGPPALNAAESDYKIPPLIYPPPKCGGRGYRASRRGRRRLGLGGCRKSGNPPRKPRESSGLAVHSPRPFGMAPL